MTQYTIIDSKMGTTSLSINNIALKKGDLLLAGSASGANATISLNGNPINHLSTGVMSWWFVETDGIFSISMTVSTLYARPPGLAVFRPNSGWKFTEVYSYGTPIPILNTNDLSFAYGGAYGGNHSTSISPGTRILAVNYGTNPYSSGEMRHDGGANWIINVSSNMSSQVSAGSIGFEMQPTMQPQTQIIG